VRLGLESPRKRISGCLRGSRPILASRVGYSICGHLRTYSQFSCRNYVRLATKDLVLPRGSLRREAPAFTPRNLHENAGGVKFPHGSLLASAAGSGRSFLERTLANLPDDPPKRVPSAADARNYEILLRSKPERARYRRSKDRGGGRPAPPGARHAPLPERATPFSRSDCPRSAFASPTPASSGSSACRRTSP
jgi:hypothetical protein